MKTVSITAHNRGSLWLVFGLTFTYFIVEVVGALMTNSLALLADAAHMLADAGGLGLALFAAWMSSKPATPTRTYGYYRVEIVAALMNAAVLFFMSFYILYEAYQRFQEPPEVQSLPMLTVAGIGLIVNLIGIRLLRAPAAKSRNTQGAFLEVVSDLLGSVGVITAAAIMWVTGWWYADSAFSVVIGIFIFPRAWKLMRQAVDVLLEASPVRINPAEVAEAMKVVEGVESVHDLHIWSFMSGINALSAHVVLADNTLPEVAREVVERMAIVLKDRFKIEHTTIQVEYASPDELETSF